MMSEAERRLWEETALKRQVLVALGYHVETARIGKNRTFYVFVDPDGRRSAFHAYEVVAWSCGPNFDTSIDAAAKLLDGMEYSMGGNKDGEYWCSIEVDKNHTYTSSTLCRSLPIAICMAWLKWKIRVRA